MEIDQARDVDRANNWKEQPALINGTKQHASFFKVIAAAGTRARRTSVSLLLSHDERRDAASRMSVRWRWWQLNKWMTRPSVGGEPERWWGLACRSEKEDDG